MKHAPLRSYGKIQSIKYGTLTKMPSLSFIADKMNIFILSFECLFFAIAIIMNMERLEIKRERAR